VNVVPIPRLTYSRAAPIRNNPSLIFYSCQKIVPLF
jgi:hypothetical protein